MENYISLSAYKNAITSQPRNDDAEEFEFNKILRKLNLSNVELTFSIAKALGITPDAFDDLLIYFLHCGNIYQGNEINKDEQRVLIENVLKHTGRDYGEFLLIWRFFYMRVMGLPFMDMDRQDTLGVIYRSHYLSAIGRNLVLSIICI